mgnify:CR=1 FL=1
MIVDVQPLKSMEEIAEMIEALGMSKKGLRNQLLFKLGISTGLRCSDLVKIKVSDVKGKTSLILNEDKTEKKRTVYLNSVLAELIEYLDTLADDEKYLFPNSKGGHISVTQVYRIQKKAEEFILPPFLYKEKITSFHQVIQNEPVDANMLGKLLERLNLHARIHNYGNAM